MVGVVAVSFGPTFFLFFLSASYSLAAQPPACRDGEAALARRDMPAAERLLRRCTEAGSADLNAWLLLCGVYQLQGNSEALLQTASEGLRRFPSEKRFYLTAGNYLGRNKEYARAIGILQSAAARWPEDRQIRGLLASAELGLGMQELDAGRNEAAEAHLRRATTLNEQDPDAYLNLGRALHNLNRFPDALAAFDRVLALDPATPLLRFHRALALLSMGAFETAASEAGREVESGSDYPPSFLVRGQARLALGEFEGALSDLDIAAQRMPESARAQLARGRCLSQLGRLREAEDALRGAARLDPGDAGPVNLLAGLLLRTGRAAEAEPFLKRAAELSRKQRSAAPGEIRFKSSAGAARP
jgi:tetratricopeptide (TPR) repeat protein